MLLCYLLADIIQSQLIIYLLQEQITAIIITLFSLLYIYTRVIFHDDPLLFLFLKRCHLRYPGTGPFNRVLAAKPFAKLFNSPELLDYLGGTLAIFFSKRFDCVQISVIATFL